MSYPKTVSKIARIQEVARLLACGWKPGDIAKELRLTSCTTSLLIRKATQLGYLRMLEDGRDETVKAMAEQRRQVSKDAWQLIQVELMREKEKALSSEEPIEQRVLNNAFRAIEHVDKIDEKRSQPINVAIFNESVLRMARADSERIMGTNESDCN